MNGEQFQELQRLCEADGPGAAIRTLIDTLRASREYHRLFDALLLQSKFEMGLSPVQPSSFDDVPEDRQSEFETCYIAAAREVGQLLLEAGKLADAWMYFRTIREPQKVADALDAVDTRRDADESTEQLIQIALYEGAHPVKGLELMLHTHGTCNTVTALEQYMPQLTAEQRAKAAGLLVRELYGDLKQTVQYEVQNKLAMTPPAKTLRELIAGRDWLFEEGNYHIDVSHLNAVVRFGRSLQPGAPELPMALELAEYGSRLGDQFQYPGDPPFDDFYPAHVQYYRALLGEDVDGAIAYFQEKLDSEPDAEDKQLIAYVMVDLLTRIGHWDSALELAAKYLHTVEQPEFSFSRLCVQAGRLDALQTAARDSGDLVSFTAALVGSESEPVSSSS